MEQPRSLIGVENEQPAQCCVFALKILQKLTLQLRFDRVLFAARLKMCDLFLGGPCYLFIYLFFGLQEILGSFAPKQDDHQWSCKGDNDC